MEALTAAMTDAQRNSIQSTVDKEQGRLLNFIRKRVTDKAEAEDILQDVFYQLVAGYKQIESLEKITSWLFSVARNKITDRHRKKKADSFSSHQKKLEAGEESHSFMLENLLPDIGNTPEDIYFRSIILDQIEEALEELPASQKEVFVMNEFEDKSFKEIAALTGDSVNTLLSRKRYAVLYLRKRLQDLYDDI